MSEAGIVAFTADLHALRQESGVSTQQIAEQAGLSRATVYRALNAPLQSRWPVVAAIVAAGGGDVREWEERWRALADAGVPELANSARAVDALGPTGLRVAKRLSELRQQRGMTLAQLESRLTSLGRPIPISSLSKSEQGQRRIDVDDLVALALALDVPPNLLLLPTTAEHVTLTAEHTLDTATAWAWASTDVPAPPAPAVLGSGDDYDYDFFISSCTADRGWSEWIAWTLEAAGFRVYHQAWELRPGDDFLAGLKVALGRSRRVVAVLSAAYASSTFARTEWEAAASSAVARPLLPVRVDDAVLSGWLGNLMAVDLRSGTEGTARELLVEAARSIAGDGPQRPRVAPAFPGRPAE